MGYLESSQARLASGAAPMDIEPGMGSLAKGHKGKGKAKGKGKGKGKGKRKGKEGKGQVQFQGECYNCGKWGHSSQNCWSPQNPKGGKGNQKGKGKGKGGKGGKGKLGSLEDQTWPTEANS